MASERYSIEYIVPLYNEEGCVDEFVARVEKLRTRLPHLDIACLFINDGSTDSSLALLEKYASQFEFVRYVNLSRNFGHQIAVTAGLDYCTADYAVIIDSDLQDPPELIEQLFDKARSENLDVVYAVRGTREKETFFKLFTAKLFYGIINALCDTNIPSNTGDFRLVSRKAIDSIKRLRERHRFLRGLFPWIGFKSGSITYDRKGRFAGETKYPFKKMFKFALDAILSFSNTPLRVATYLGFLTIVFGFIGILAVLYLRLFTDYTVPGISAVLFAVVFMGGIQILMLGILGEYVGRIFEEIKGRPLYFVDGTANIDVRRTLRQTKDAESSISVMNR